jgi:hypothetical protein
MSGKSVMNADESADVKCGCEVRCEEVKKGTDKQGFVHSALRSRANNLV